MGGTKKKQTKPVRQAGRQSMPASSILWVGERSFPIKENPSRRITAAVIPVTASNGNKSPLPTVPLQDDGWGAAIGATSPPYDFPSRAHHTTQETGSYAPITIRIRANDHDLHPIRMINKIIIHNQNL